MEIIVYLLITLFLYLLTSAIYNFAYRSIENMSNLGDFSSQIGENRNNISNLKETLNKTLTRAKTLIQKIDGIKKQSGFNTASDAHPSVKSLNVTPKKTECFTGITETEYNNLNSKNQNNYSQLGALKSITTDIENKIKTIKNKLK